MQVFQVGHREQAEFLLEAFGEVGRAAETGVERDLCDAVGFLTHLFLGPFETEFFQQYIG